MSASLTPAAAPTSISLVLGSGGARGYAHIGVIEELLAHGYAIRSIAGSSMGALVGGVYAAGKLDAYRDWVLPLHRLDVLRMLDWTFSGGGFINGDRIIRAMRTYIGDIAIEDLPISFTAVTVDLDAQREVWFSRGSLFDAIRASIAIPTVFRPHHVDGRLLVDGGLLNPLPVSPTLRDRTDATIAVDVNGQAEPLDDQEAQLPPAASNGGIRRMVDSLFDKREQAAARDPGVLELFARSLDAVQETITRLKLAAQPPDLLITIPRNICAFYDFHRAEAAIEMGRQRTREALARWTGPRDHHDWRR